MNIIRVGDLDLNLTNEDYTFVPKDKSIYEIQALFEKQTMSKKQLGIIFITEKGTNREKIE